MHNVSWKISLSQQILGQPSYSLCVFQSSFKRFIDEVSLMMRYPYDEVSLIGLVEVYMTRSMCFQLLSRRQKSPEYCQVVKYTSFPSDLTSEAKGEAFDET